MASFDFLVGKIGVWTIITSFAYGLIGFIFYMYFKNKKSIGLKTYAKSSIAGVLLFDISTGPIMSSFLFRLPFEIALIGQIPFTILHLASAVTLTIILAPVLDAELRPNVCRNLTRVFELFKTKRITGWYS